jgi:hypothetical protein
VPPGPMRLPLFALSSRLDQVGAAHSHKANAGESLGHAASSQDVDQQQHSPQNEIAYQHKAEDARAEGVQQHDWRKTIETECWRYNSSCSVLLVLVSQIFG